MPRTPLRMPKMSMTMEEGELVGWKVAVGETVTEGQVVCEVLTDKVDMEVEAPATGTLVGIDVTEGETVPVGTPIAWIETQSDSLIDDLFGPPAAAPAAAAPPPAAPPAPPAPPAAAPAPPAPAPVAPAAAGASANGILPAIPGARRLAAEHNLPLAQILGSGPGGAVMVSDVRAVMDAVPSAVVQPFEADAWAARAEALRPRAGEELSAPGATLWRDAVLAGAGPPEPGLLLAALVAATSAALTTAGPATVRERPRVAALVPTPAGSVPLTLVAPHTRPLADVAAELSAAAGQARAGSVDVRHLATPDVTVTSLEQVDRVVVPVRPGTLLSLGVGAAASRVVATASGVGVRTVVTLSATADVRAGDAAAVATWLAAVASTLEAGIRA